MALRASRADAVVIVKGDQLGDDFWTALEGRPHVLWLYDELRRTRWKTRSMTIVGPICSYSRLDAEALMGLGLPARHLPLAFDHQLRPHPPSRRMSETVFIGARYPERQRTLEALADGGIPVRAFGRDWSHHPWDRLRTWDLRRPTLPAGRDLDRGDAYDTMTAARATLNIHGDQDGFTMRTFEACGAGALQLIDRSDLQGLYDDGSELASYSSDAEMIDLCHRAAVDIRWSERVRTAARARTMAEHTFDHRVKVLEESWG
ncbi:CgeB family protein [Nocardioides sp.]|uniref:CgeB family protein n=1 Tax=Nocardioides sp. TaxID=35761 RepID=UPI002BE963DD|nr:glycosyltransferase [Nocardioides sp.]HXH77213.1 glycosyltransferase [Nocardioides sp.]